MNVWPRNDDIRRLIKHPSGALFRKDGPSDWPNDSYTARRIADGDVTTEAPPPPEQQQAHHRKPSRAEARQES